MGGGLAGGWQVCRGTRSCNGHAEGSKGAASKTSQGGAEADSLGDASDKTPAARSNEGSSSGGASGGADGGGGKVGGDSKRAKGFLFLRELFEIAKPLQMTHQMSFYRALCAVGLFSILEVRGWSQKRPHATRHALEPHAMCVPPRLVLLLLRALVGGEALVPTSLSPTNLSPTSP